MRTNSDEFNRLKMEGLFRFLDHNKSDRNHLLRSPTSSILKPPTATTLAERLAPTLVAVDQVIIKIDDFQKPVTNTIPKLLSLRLRGYARADGTSGIKF